MSAETRYFGQPRHCFTIDGEWWHEPGTCPGALLNCPGKCCGVDAELCDRCGAVMDDKHCKLICPVCGYTRDCSDP